jgi:hypothetical protein
MRYALIGALFAGLPAFAAAATKNTDHPITPETAPAPKPNLDVATPAPHRLGAVDRAPISQPAAAAVAAPVVASPVGNGTPNPLASMAQQSDLNPLGVRPAATPVKILYAPGEADDPVFRAAVAAITGGVVDYFDARSATPTAVQLAAYNCVYTWVNSPYSDRVTFGNRLADFVDAGGKVILGVFCTYTSGASLGGRIMTVGYSPVTSPAGSNHFTNSAYAGDGFRSLHAGVLAYGETYRDVLVTQGGGVVNGHYADAEIAQAYRPDGRVIYSNGSGAAPTAGSGDWVKVIANAAMADPGAPGMLTAPADADDPTYRANIAALTTGVVDYFNSATGTASAALIHTYDCIYSWANNTFNDPATWGDRLADRADEGGRIILGIATTLPPYGITGRIMTPDYCPVVRAGNLHVSGSTYGGDGATSLLSGAGLLACNFRDAVVGQGAGIIDGHYGDGEVVAAYRPDGHIVYVNGCGNTAFGGTGNWPQVIANACGFVPSTGHRMLYAPANTVDDPVLRRKLAESTGGIVDFFDASSATPTALQLSAYDCVYTWSNLGYQDAVTFGNRLADFVDAGGKVILGSFTTYNGYQLAGRIMTPAYCPVSNPTLDDHYSLDSYAGDGTTCFQHGIATFASMFRDVLVLQGSGIAESHYLDGEIAVAYRPDRRVVYINGLFLFGTGDWARLIANGCDCGDTPGVLFACNANGKLYTLNTKTGAATFDLDLPPGGSTEIEYMPNGHMWVQERDGVSSGYQANPYTGAALTPVVATARIYNGLEYAIGRLWGAGIPPVSCNGSTWAVVDPTTGTDFATLGPTGQPPLPGLAFDRRWSTMYGVTSGCAGPSNLVRIDVTTGAATVLGSTGVGLGSLEFGPEGDLYAGGDGGNGGNLYRVNLATGFARLIGTTGMGSVTGITLGVNGTVAAGPAPVTLEFSAPYPNPSREGMVQFRFSIPTASNVRLELFDVAGRLRWSESMNGLDAGPHSVTWNGLASNGARLASGIYHMRLVSSVGSRTVRLVRFE